MKALSQKTGRCLALSVAFLVLFFSLASSVSAAIPVCTALTADVSYGQTDPSSPGPVLSLQDFLVAEGYLSAAPNGHFGPATLVAVEAFQSKEGISPTGYVGTLTRAAISGVSCMSSATSPAPTQSSAPAPSPSSAFVAPTSGATLSLGQTYTIAWNGASKAGYSIVLENQDGLSQGFITANAQTGSYQWQVGNVLSAVTDTYSTVAPGTYRIHLYNISGGAPDIIGPAFTIITPPLTVASVMPLTVSASNNATMVMYGSGFNASPQVSIDGYYNFHATVLYASPDGTVIVFAVPAGLASGSHVVDISNTYGSLATSPSFNVTQ